MFCSARVRRSSGSARGVQSGQQQPGQQGTGHDNRYDSHNHNNIYCLPHINHTYI